MHKAFSVFSIRLFITLGCLCFGVISCSTRHYKMNRAEKMYQQGQHYLAKGEREKAMAKFQDSLEMAELIDFKPGIAHNLNEMGLVYTFKREFSEAREVFGKSLAIYRELDMEPEISKTMNNIAITHAKQNNYEAALEQWEELVQWDAKRDNDLGVALTLYNMGTVYQNHLRQTEKAFEKYHEALEIFKRLGKEENAQLIENILNKK